MYGVPKKLWRLSSLYLAIPVVGGFVVPYSYAALLRAYTPLGPAPSHNVECTHPPPEGRLESGVHQAFFLVHNGATAT